MAHGRGFSSPSGNIKAVAETQSPLNRNCDSKRFLAGKENASKAKD
jgi:hypothetical protein